ncbi:hypothetical protein BaRGS_00018596, partial [Batillaria attramentaria]
TGQGSGNNSQSVAGGQSREQQQSEMWVTSPQRSPRHAAPPPSSTLPPRLGPLTLRSVARPTGRYCTDRLWPEAAYRKTSAGCTLPRKMYIPHRLLLTGTVLATSSGGTGPRRFVPNNTVKPDTWFATSLTGQTLIGRPCLLQRHLTSS